MILRVWLFRFVAVLVYDHLGLWPFRFLAFRFLAVSIVAVLGWGRYDLLPQEVYMTCLNNKIASFHIYSVMFAVICNILYDCIQYIGSIQYV